MCDEKFIRRSSKIYILACGTLFLEFEGFLIVKTEIWDSPKL